MNIHLRQLSPSRLASIALMTATVISAGLLTGCNQNRFEPATWRKDAKNYRNGTTLPGTTLPGTTLPEYRFRGSTLPRSNGSTLPGTTLPKRRAQRQGNGTTLPD